MAFVRRIDRLLLQVTRPKVLRASAAVLPFERTSMTRSRVLLIGALTLGTLLVPSAAAMASPNVASPACADSWKAPASGLWSVAGNWTAGVPGEAGPVAACITVPGTYTVTLAPWSIGTADPNHQFAAITSLILGAAIALQIKKSRDNR